jgi:uncharacterized protein
VITGASSGIGYYLARVFAENGYDLFVTADSDKINTVLRDFETFDVEVDSLQVDLTAYEAVEELWSALDDTGREINAIAINAGIGVGGDFARETDLDEELKLIQLNVTSTVHLAKRVLKQWTGTKAKFSLPPQSPETCRRPSKRFTGLLRPSCNHSPNHCGAN